MPFNSLTDRTDAAVLIPEEESREIIRLAAVSSAALRLMRNVRMSTKLFVQPVLAALAQAYWVNGDVGLKQTTEVNWAGAQLVAEELATIVPVPDAVVDDAGFPIWEEVRQIVADAVAFKLDQAVFAGIDKPPTWPAAIVPAATAAGNTDVADTTPANGGIATDLGTGFDRVEDDGYDVTGIAAPRKLRSRLRKARDTSGQKLLDVSTTSAYEVDIAYVENGTMGDTTLAVVGDFSLAVVGIRQDLTFKLLDQASLTDDTGKVILNLAQQDAQALRVTARYGYAVAAPVSRPVTGSGTPFPFSVLTSA